MTENERAATPEREGRKVTLRITKRGERKVPSLPDPPEAERASVTVTRSGLVLDSYSPPLTDEQLEGIEALTHHAASVPEVLGKGEQWTVWHSHYAMDVPRLLATVRYWKGEAERLRAVG